MEKALEDSMKPSQISVQILVQLEITFKPVEMQQVQYSVDQTYLLHFSASEELLDSMPIISQMISTPLEGLLETLEHQTSELLFLLLIIQTQEVTLTHLLLACLILQTTSTT